MNKKSFLLSKTLWTNVVAAIAFFVQSEYGYVIDPAIQMQFIALVNMALRFVTKTGLQVSPTV